MNLSRLSAVWISLCALLVMPLAASQVRGASSQQPNIVLIISDDQAWTDYGFMGHELIRTPHLDQLAATSVLFDRGYVPTALCRPSLMTLATGHYAHRHGVTGNDPSPKDAKQGSPLYQERRAQLIGYLDRFESLPERLQQLGYLTHQSGKWWEGSFSNGGFTHGMTRGFPQPGGRHGDDGLKIGREGLQPIEDFVDHAMEEEKPFFLWYAPFLPHTPHQPPERLLAQYRDRVDSIHLARYYAMCEWFDETCGQMMKMIGDKGLEKNTLVVYVTDNGWIQHPERKGYDLKSKQSPYEAGVRTPIMFRWPGHLKPSHRSDLVSSIDIFPTLLAAAGGELPGDLPGLDLMPSLKSGHPLARKQIFGEGFAHDIADIENPEASLLYRWTIRDEWKLLLTYDGEVNRYQSTHPRAEKGPQLFHLRVDPHEKRNVADLYPDQVQTMVESLAQWYPVMERQTLTRTR